MMNKHINNEIKLITFAYDTINIENLTKFNRKKCWKNQINMAVEFEINL